VIWRAIHSAVTTNPTHQSHNHSARDARALAQGRLSLLLALEIASTGRAATDRDGAAMDLFVVPTIGFELLYGFVIVRIDRRDLVWINETSDTAG
jgi:hypothetical protein